MSGSKFYKHFPLETPWTFNKELKTKVITISVLHKTKHITNFAWFVARSN